MDLEKWTNLFGAETIKKIYEDGVSDSVKEISKIAVDIIKTFRLFTAPVQLASTYQDRLAKYFEKVRASVPVENQIEAPSSIAGPIIDRLKYLEEGNYLIDLYLNLLSRAIDKERINEAHPAFFHLIDQLSPDEAFFLYKAKDDGIKITTEMDYDADANWFSNYRIIKTEFSETELTFPENFEMYYSHLESLNLTAWPVLNTEYPKNEEGVQVSLIKHTKIHLTDFGKLFVKACIPEKGFILFK